MDAKNNPFEFFKDIPYFNEKVVKKIADKGWFDPEEILNHFGQFKRPLIDLVETNNEVIIAAELPGLRNAGDVSVVLKGYTLKIAGETIIEPYSLDELKTHRQERQSGKFSRSINLPAEVDSKNYKASYSQGILKLKFTKISDNQVKTLDIEFANG